MTKRIECCTQRTPRIWSRIVVLGLVAAMVCTSLPRVAVAAAALSGEQIKWQVLSGGGGQASSTNFRSDGTLGQTAIGLVTSTNYKTSQGFWQTFSCCIGTTGNVDGSLDGVVDISDVFAMVDYLSSNIPLSDCAAANDENKDGTIDISDLFALIDYLSGAAPLPSCP